MKKAMGRLGAVVGWRTTVSQKEFEPRVARYSEFLRKAKNMDLAFFFTWNFSIFESFSEPSKIFAGFAVEPDAGPESVRRRRTRSGRANPLLRELGGTESREHRDLDTPASVSRVLPERHFLGPQGARPAKRERGLHPIAPTPGRQSVPWRWGPRLSRVGWTT